MRGLFQALVEQSHDLIVALDTELRVVWANPRVQSMLGYVLAEVTGTPIEEFIHPDDEEEAARNLEAFFAGEVPTDPTVVRARRADGSYCWVDVIGFGLPAGLEPATARLALSVREVDNREESNRSLLTKQAWHEAALRRHHRRIQALLAHSSDAVVVISPNGSIERINRQRGLFGQRDPGDTEADPYAFVHDGDQTWLREHFAGLADAPGRSITAIFRVLAPGEVVRWIEATATNMLDDEDVNGYVVNYRDVTDRVEAERHAARLLEVLEVTVDLVGICDPKGRLLHLNSSARTFGGVEGSLEGMVVPGDWIVDGSAADLDELLGELNHHGSWSGELSIRNRDGEAVPMIGRMIAHRGPSGEVEFYSWILHDISDRKAQEDRLAHRATHDLLTGLPNRSVLADHLRAAARSERGGGLVALLFVDLDRFKEVNDDRGHAEGDTVLRQIAGRLREAVRPDDLVVRFGGDEFVVVLRELDDVEVAENVAQRVLDALVDPFPVGADQVQVGASIGIAITADRDLEPEDLVRRADRAMYLAKRSGRGRYVTEQTPGDDPVTARTDPA